MATQMEQSKYVISLDSLDLSLLPTYKSRLNNIPSLWSASNLSGTNDYFQFEIKPKTTEETSESLDPEDIDDILEETTCYICNLKVPVAYIADHENSMKHQAFVRIADVVLDRARQHMLKRDNKCNVRRIDSMYFCGPCVMVVPATDKEKHEKSRLHKRSISLDRLLNELVSLYTDDENTETETKVMSRNLNKLDELNVTDNVSIDDNANDVKSEIDRDFNSEIDRNVETVVISDIEACLNKHETEKRPDTFKVKANGHVKNAPVNYITIETLDGCEVSVPEDNFHGFMRIGKHHLQCKVCKLIIKNEEEHRSSKEHVTRILQPFKDKHCVRNLNNSWSHCVICNEIIENSDVHALCNESHERLLQKALVVHNLPPNKFNILIEQNQKDTQDSSDYYCAVCNLVMHVNNTDSHINGTKHAMNSKSSLHYNMKQVEGSDDLICRVCDVQVSDSPMDVKKHVKTTGHFHNLKLFLSKNNVRKENDSFYCKPCDVTITKMNEFYHIEKISHEINLAASKESVEACIKASGSNTDKLSREVNLTASKENVLESSKASGSNTDKLSHEVNLTASKESVEVSSKASGSTDGKNDETKSIDKLNVYYCHVCNVNIPNNPKNIKSHNDGNKHKKNVKNVLAEIENAIDRVAANNTPYQMEFTQNEKEFRCKACNVIVPNRESNIDEHVKGTKHKNNEKKVMECNRIEIRDERYFCNVCNVFILNEHQFLHIELPIHVRLLNNTHKQENTDTTQKQNTPAGKTEQDKTDTDKITEKVLPKNATVYSVLNHHFSEIDKDIVCKVCNIKIPHTQYAVLQHLSEKAHVDGYKELMSRNLVFETDSSTFFCGICNCLIPGKGEFHHVLGLRHAGNFIKVTNNDRCDVCDITVVMTDHIATSQHITKVKQNQTMLNYCMICEALITKTDRDIEQHNANCALMVKHKLVVKDKICFCIICDLYFARDLIEEHTQSNHHMLLFNMIT